MERNASLDILKLLMAFMVVGLHSQCFIDDNLLISYLFVNGIFRIAVPVFFIINGFFFYSVISKDSQINWLRRIFILYLIWMMIYSFFWFFIPGWSIYKIAKLFHDILIGYFHLWYLTGLLGAALILLFLKKYNPRILLASIMITFIIGVAIQYAGNYHVFSGNMLDKVFNKSLAHRNFIFFSYPFFCLGYLINKYQIHTNISDKHVVTLTLLGMFLLILESYINYLQPTSQTSFDNLFFLILAAPAIFILFIKQNIFNQKIFFYSKNISLCSSAVYFIHILILNILKDVTNFKGTLLTLATIGGSLLASFVLIQINKKIKYREPL